MERFDRPKMANPARYQILVQGHIPSERSGYLGGMTVTTLVQEDGTTATSLEGELTDQAALLGVLNTLSNMHFSLISVCFLDEDKCRP